MSRRDRAIVAKHEVPGLEFGHFREQKPTARPEELGLLGVERGSPGPKGPAPKGLKNLAQGLPWVFGLRLEALKGRPLTRRQGTSLEMPVAPSGLLTLGRVSQDKPWAKLCFGGTRSSAS
jgi:hypothetical protein